MSEYVHYLDMQVFSLLSKLTDNPSLSCSLALCGVLASCSSLHFDPSIEV